LKSSGAFFIALLFIFLPVRDDTFRPRNLTDSFLLLNIALLNWAPSLGRLKQKCGCKIIYAVFYLQRKTGDSVWRRKRGIFVNFPSQKIKAPSGAASSENHLAGICRS
jgi:hypothetical protein